MSAKQLMTILVKAGCRPNEPVATAQIENWAAAAGLRGIEYLDALTSADGSGWLSQARPGYATVTQAGWDAGNA